MRRLRQAPLLTTRLSSSWKIMGYRTYAPGVPLPVQGLTRILLVSPIVTGLDPSILEYRISVRPITWHCWGAIRSVVGIQVASQYLIRTLWTGLNLSA